MNRPAGAELEAARKRVRNVLVAGVALGSTGHIAAVTVATIVARRLLGDDGARRGCPARRSCSAPRSARSLLSALMARRGRRRRPGRRLRDRRGRRARRDGAPCVGARSRCCSLGTLLIGFGNSSNQLSRYAAADIVPDRPAGVRDRHRRLGRDRRRGRSGRTLVADLGRLAIRARPARRWPGRTSCPIVFVGARRDPVLRRCSGPTRTSSPTRLAPATARRPRATARSDRAILRRPAVAAAIVALVVGQVVMVLIMTMTPLHMTEHGHDLGGRRHRASAATRSGCSRCRRSPGG